MLGFYEVLLMVKFSLNGILSRKTTSCAEEAPLRASATVAREEDAVGLVLGAIVNQEADVKMNRERRTLFLKP